MLGEYFLLFGNKKMVLPQVKNNFACRTQFLLRDHMFRSLGDQCPGLNANEIQIHYEKHHRVSVIGKKSPKHTQFRRMM